MSDERPMKAYYVERITRGVTTALVYAEDPQDAKRRYLAVVRQGTSAVPLDRLASATLAHELGGRRHRLLMALAGEAANA